MRVFLEEMVLDLPDVIEAEPVGELDLIERVLIKPALGIVIPRTAGELRQLVFVEQTEFHWRLTLSINPLPRLRRGSLPPPLAGKGRWGLPSAASARPGEDRRGDLVGLVEFGDVPGAG